MVQYTGDRIIKHNIYVAYFAFGWLFSAYITPTNIDMESSLFCPYKNWQLFSSVCRHWWGKLWADRRWQGSTKDPLHTAGPHWRAVTKLSVAATNQHPWQHHPHPLKTCRGQGEQTRHGQDTVLPHLCLAGGPHQQVHQPGPGPNQVRRWLGVCQARDGKNQVLILHVCEVYIFWIVKEFRCDFLCWKLFYVRN